MSSQNVKRRAVAFQESRGLIFSTIQQTYYESHSVIDWCQHLEPREFVCKIRLIQLRTGHSSDKDAMYGQAGKSIAKKPGKRNQDDDQSDPSLIPNGSELKEYLLDLERTNKAQFLKLLLANNYAWQSFHRESVSHQFPIMLFMYEINPCLLSF